MNLLRYILAVVLFSWSTASFAQVEKIKITDLEKLMSESTQPLIINFWATWCKPCVEEIPYFLEEQDDHKKDSLRLILVSVDADDQFPAALNKFVVKRKYERAKLFWLDETNADYFCPKVDEKWSGAIPATLLLNNKTGYHKFFEEQIPHKQLKEELKMMLRN